MAPINSSDSDPRDYRFKGTIGEEHVWFYNVTLNGEYGEDECSFDVLEVRRADGTVVKYVDNNADLKLDWIAVIKDGETRTFYACEHIFRNFFEEGQSQFNAYLARIRELKVRRAIRDLKGE